MHQVDDAAQRALDDVGYRFRGIIDELFPPIHYKCWRYKKPRGSYWQFGYTVDRIKTTPGAKAMYLARAFKSTDGGESWKIVRTVKFARRWKAKDRAYKWYCQKAGIPFKSLHQPRRLTDDQKAAFSKPMPARRNVNGTRAQTR